MARITVGPFNRVEGDLEVHIDVADGQVSSARVNSPLFRGFEQILIGKDPRDALVYTPRICGICSVSQSVAGAYALRALSGVTPPLNGELVTNLILASENVADHFTHFYLFFMPDFARAVYADQPWFAPAVQRFKAVGGSAAADAARARAEFLHLLGILAGKWPHTLAIQPGGSTRAVRAHEKSRLQAVLAGFRRFLERTTFGDDLETVIALQSPAELGEWAARKPCDHSDLCLFLHIAEQLKLERIGRAADRFMSYGGYPVQGEYLFSPGVYAGELQPLDATRITEDLSHSWMRGPDEPTHPTQGRTIPDENKAAAYSWCKAPRLAGQVVEVGALARQLVDGHPLVVQLVADSGANVRNRVIARLLEIARVVVAMQEWIDRIDPAAPFCERAPLPAQGRSAGLVEAARGSLGHWLEVADGRIKNYQIVAPTTWNFSPRDRDGVPGALEQALVGAPVRAGETDPVAVQHIVRSFDPCMVLHRTLNRTRKR